MKKLLALLILPLAVWAEFRVPELTGPIVDQAGMLSNGLVRDLGKTLRDLRQTGGPQISVLTVNDLDNLTIEEASIKVTDSWKLGKADKDNGLLILIAKKERSARIEVGQGLEGVVPDVFAKRIIEGVMLPNFRDGNFDQGILKAVIQIVSLTNPEINFEKLGKKYGVRKRSVSGNVFIFIIVFVLFILGQIRNSIFGRRGFGGFYSGGWGGGSGGSSGGWGGSGGWSGGGGGFSGGGASGRW